MSTASEQAKRSIGTIDRSNMPQPPATPAAHTGNGSSQQTEQAALMLLGGALLIRGLRSRSFGGTLMVLSGGTLLYQGARRLPQLAEALGLPAVHPLEPTPVEIKRTITIGKGAQELYQLWRAPQTLSQIVGAIAEVTMIDQKRIHWQIQAPLGQQLAWDTQIVEDQPGTLLRWESMPDAEMKNTGTVRFTSLSGGQATEVSLEIGFEPPGGELGAAAAKVLSALPKTFAGHVLRSFKSLAETGEIPTTKSQSAARNNGRGQ